MAVRTLPFYKLSPGGNPTILVRDNSLFSQDGSAAERAAIARVLMDPDHLGAEQVGFLDTSRALPHMEMMGGEFCVNATRCAAFIFALLGLLPKGGPPGIHEGIITASGAADPVRVRVAVSPAGMASLESAAGEAAIALPLPSTAVHGLVHMAAPGEALVRLPGITHVLLDAAMHPVPENPCAPAAAKRAEHGLDAEEAAGVIWHFPGPGGATAILPVVHVAATGSTVVETACGSGSLAVALLLAHHGGCRFAIRQPSGHTMRITLEPPRLQSGPLLAWIDGIVRLTADGNAYVNIP